MALPPWALCTLAQFKRYATAAGTGKDDLIEDAIRDASRQVEGYCDRRIVYRAPPEVSTADNIVNSVLLVNGAQTIAAQPNSAGRTMVVTVTDLNRSITAGLITLTGTVAGVAGVVETFDLMDGLQQHGTKFFTGNVTCAASNVVGNASGDFLKVGSSVGYVEEHTLTRPLTSTARLLEWPLAQVLSVNEDPNRVFGASTQLTLTTDYMLNISEARVVRTSVGLPFFWMPAWRSVRVTYSAGYRCFAVPEDIRNVTLTLAALIYRESTRGEFGVASQTDATGNFTRFGPAMLTDWMKAKLAPWRRWEQITTGERDFDLEAA